MIGANYLENLSRIPSVLPEKATEIQRVIGTARDAAKDLSSSGFKLNAERVQAVENAFNQLPPNTRAVLDRVPYEGWDQLPTRSLHQLVEIQRLMHPLVSDMEEELLILTGELDDGEPKNGISAVEITSDLDKLPASVAIEFLKSLI